MTATALDLTIEQGKTFKRIVRWETAPVVYVPITAITQAAPVVITAAGHGLKSGWRAAVIAVKGMSALNAVNAPPRASDYHPVTVIDSSTISFNDVSSANFKPYINGGYLQFNTPQDLTGFTARMAIKDKIGGTLLDTLTDANGKIVLDVTTHLIELVLSAVVTAAYTWTSGVYDLELVSPTGEVTALLSGNVSVTPEVTT